MPDSNKVINDFGDEWKRFDFSSSENLDQLQVQFEKYISPIPKDFFKKQRLVIADFGAGTGRWAYFLKEFASKIYVVEPSKKAFEVCKAKFKGDERVTLLNQSVESNDVPPESLDLAVSLGVLHHIEDTGSSIKLIASRIKPRGLFLGYLYYALENKPRWYRCIWKVSDAIRKLIAYSPQPLKIFMAELIALLIYLPLAKASQFLKKIGFKTSNLPLHHYADLSFYVMRNDALDRFGTTLEQRFSKMEIQEMLENAGFSSIVFSEQEPFWTFSAVKSPRN